MRAYVTGGEGFVGKWLHEHLTSEGDVVVDPPTDITDAAAIRDAITEAAPDAIYHLAAISHVGDSWGAPEETFRVNATGTLHVLEAARRLERVPTVLLVCSAEVYGRVAPEDLPLTEEAPLRPVSPYAASKVAAEFLGVQEFLAHGLPVIRVRAFNHIGPGQGPSFVVSSLGRQIAQVLLEGATVVRVGNLTPQRDFTDVRDVVRAYRLLVERGAPGEVYNVCSGEAVAVEEIARRMLSIAGLDLTVEIDHDLIRPVDVPVLRGDNSRLVAATGWGRERALDETLSDVIDSWRTQLAGSR